MNWKIGDLVTQNPEAKFNDGTRRFKSWTKPLLGRVVGTYGKLGAAYFSVKVCWIIPRGGHSTWRSGVTIDYVDDTGDAFIRAPNGLDDMLELL